MANVLRLAGQVETGDVLVWKPENVTVTEVERDGSMVTLVGGETRVGPMHENYHVELDGDAHLRNTLARVKAPVTVTFDERWHLNLVETALQAERRKAEGAVKRAKHGLTKTNARKHADALDAVLATVAAAKKETATS